MKYLAPLILAAVVGCATLDKLDEPDPETGRTPAQNIQQTASDLGGMLPMPFNWIVPAATAGILTVLVAAGNAGKKDEEEPT